MGKLFSRDSGTISKSSVSSRTVTKKLTSPTKKMGSYALLALVLDSYVKEDLQGLRS